MTKKTTKKALIASLFSLLLCFSMLIGTTFAWFTDSVTSSGNIIQSGTLDVEMYWAEGIVDPTTADWTDASKGAMFNNTLWEPGYAEAKHIKVENKGTLAFNWEIRIVANGVVSKLADVIDVYYFESATALDRDTINGAERIGTLAEVLGSGESSLNALYRHVNGSLLEGETCEFTLALKMQETAGNEYQNLSIGTNFSVELIATQKSYEKDSFDDKYDANVPNPSTPYAYVTPLEGDELEISYTLGIGGEASEGNLDVGYKFEPTIFNQNPDGNNEIDDVDSSLYKHWHADFYVYADRDVPADSIGLAGYYDAWCQYNDDNWVALTNDGMDIKAGEGVRLVDSMGVGCVTYKNICQYGNDGIGFLCGAYAIDAEALAGTTLTVELRLYKTDVEWTESSHGTCNETGAEDYITIGAFKYTFPAYEVEGQNELNAALDSGVKDISVAAGTYTFPANKLAADTTLYCEEGTVFEGVSSLNVKGATVIGATFDASNNTNFETGAGTGTINGVFKDCTFTGNNALRWCYAGETVVFEDCVFSGDTYGAHFDGGATEVIFKNCTLSGFNATAQSIEKVTFNGCTFVSNGKSGYNGINSWGSTDYINCTFVFDGSATYEWVHLRGEGETMTFTNCEVVGGGELTDYIEAPASGVIIIDGVKQ